MKSILLVPAVFIAFNCMAQKVTPPSAVKSAFEKDFPGITVKSWDKEGSNYEANFIKDKKEMSATFNAEGTLKETETDIAIKELPTAVTDYVSKNYSGSHVTEAAMVTKPNGEKMYEAEVKGKDLLFDMQGKFIKAEHEESKKEDKH